MFWGNLGRGPGGWGGDASLKDCINYWKSQRYKMSCKFPRIEI